MSHGDDDGQAVHNSSTLTSIPSVTSAGNIPIPGITNVGYYTFFRFLNVTIPNAATIDAAKLTLRTGEDAESGDLDLYDFRIDALDQDSTSRPVHGTGGNTVNQGGTEAVVNWPLTSSVADDADLDTPEIKTVLQEIVNRGGWASGNAITFRIYNTKTSEPSPMGLSECNLHIVAYDGDSSNAAKLVVTYTA